jgi:hypothetical protein
VSKAKAVTIHLPLQWLMMKRTTQTFLDTLTTKKSGDFANENSPSWRSSSSWTSEEENISRAASFGCEVYEFNNV